MVFMDEHAHKTGNPTWTESQYRENVMDLLTSPSVWKTLNTKDEVIHVFVHGDRGLNVENPVIHTQTVSNTRPATS